MLVQMPRGLPRRSGGAEARERGQFEDGLTRDLAGAALISYNPVLGGLSKRIFDVGVAIFFAPAWLTVLAAHYLSARLRKTPAFASRDYVGYGAKAFSCLVFPEQPVADTADRQGGARARRGAVFARLPQVWAVLRGDMSLVGPRPLSSDEVAHLRNGMRHYLSMRPGLFCITAIIDAETDAEEPAHYKAYFMSWSVLADAVILWQELNDLWREG